MKTIATKYPSLNVLAGDTEFYSQASAWNGHKALVFMLLSYLRPNVFVELGSHNGDSFFTFCHAAKLLSDIDETYNDYFFYPVDSWEGEEHAGIYESDVYRDFIKYNNENFSVFSRPLKKFFHNAAEDFTPHTVDLLHIDGLHTYDAVKSDFETWLPKMSSRGVVLFHDISETKEGFGVYRYWDELKDRYPSFGFLHSHGLGVLAVGNEVPSRFLNFLNDANNSSSEVRKHIQQMSQLAQIKDYWQKEEKNGWQLRLINGESEKLLSGNFLVDDSSRLNGLRGHYQAIIDNFTKNYDLSVQHIANLEARYSSLEMEYSDLKTECSDLKTECSDLNGQLTNSQLEILQIKNNLQLIEDSLSWTMTRPLRYISRGVRYSKFIIKILPGRIKEKGIISVFLGGCVRIKRRLSISNVSSLEDNVAEKKEILDDYQEWLQQYNTKEEGRAAEIISRLPQMRQPLISIVMPVYNTDEEFLRLCIDSVLNQSYKNWELCIADDASTKPYVKKVLKYYGEKDERIKVIFRKENGHISEATNSAMALAGGEWTGLLDHDDELHRDSLLYVVNTLNEVPNAEFIYSDEDKIDIDGNRSEPHFKSDWNLDLFYSQNYVSHLGIYKTDILKSIGGFRLGYEGSQDYDLLLRYSREIDHTNIVHIPNILYHWRIVEGSTALASGEKSYTTEAGIQALESHFDALSEDVYVEQGKRPNTYKVNWKIIDEPLVSLIIPTYNGHEITKQAIDSILNKSTYKNFEILLVDNNSDDSEALSYFDELSKNDKVTVLRYPHPFNYSAINNFAAKYAKGSILGLINNDVEVINTAWLAEMVSHAQRDDVGCVGAMLYYDNDTIQHAGVILGIGGVAGHSHKHFDRGAHGYFSRLELVQNLSAVTAACMVVRKEIYDELGGLEEALSVAFNDVDFCLRVREAGYKNVFTPYAELYHHESVSRGTEDSPEKKARFNGEVSMMEDRWGDKLEKDPYYNKNLTLTKEDFSVRINT
jgi:GT2 family glycosyltransferase